MHFPISNKAKIISLAYKRSSIVILIFQFLFLACAEPNQVNLRNQDNQDSFDNLDTLAFVRCTKSDYMMCAPDFKKRNCKDYGAFPRNICHPKTTSVQALAEMYASRCSNVGAKVEVRCSHGRGKAIAEKKAVSSEPTNNVVVNHKSHGNVIGAVEGISGGIVHGWACTERGIGFTQVKFYLDDPNARHPIGWDFALEAAKSPEEKKHFENVCQSKRRNARFAFKIRDYYKHVGKTIFVKAEYTGGGNENSVLLVGSGMKIPTDNNVIGAIASTSDGIITGYACSKYHEKPIDVHVYLKGSAGQGGEGVATGKANIQLEGVTANHAKKKCGVRSSKHGFKIDISDWESRFGQKVFVHGIHPSGGENSLLDGSGVRKISTKKEVKGVVDYVADGKVAGWACNPSKNRKILVDISVRDEKSSKVVVKGANATMPSIDENDANALKAECFSDSSSFRFEVEIPNWQDYIGKTVDVVGYFNAKGGFWGGLNSSKSSPTNLTKSGHHVIKQSNKTPIIGIIDSVDEGKVSGWACAQGHSAPIDVHVYLGNAAENGGLGIASALADLFSHNEIDQEALRKACKSSYSAVRFEVTVPQWESHKGKAVYIHGIHPDNGENKLIGLSGQYTL